MKHEEHDAKIKNVVARSKCPCLLALCKTRSLILAKCDEIGKTVAGRMDTAMYL